MTGAMRRVSEMTQPDQALPRAARRRTQQEYEIPESGSLVVVRFGDITEAQADVVVSSASSRLDMSGGVSMAIRRAGGEEIRTQLIQVREAATSAGREPGNVLVTGAGSLPMSHVFHAVTIPAPGRDADVEDPAAVIKEATRNCLRRLAALDLGSIAFPALGTGTARFSPLAVAVTMADVIKEFLVTAQRSFRVEIWLHMDRLQTDLDFLEFFREFSRSSGLGRFSVRRHTVLMLHGIRSQAEWHDEVEGVLRRGDANLNPISTGYQYFDLFRFIVPIESFRRPVIDRIKKALVEQIDDPKVDQVSVIAHSFGTYVIWRILQDDSRIRLHRLILCGGIIPDDFEWQRLRGQIDRLNDIDDPSRHVINDCGWRDFLPVLAGSVTWGYGPSGRLGFKNSFVRDRYFDMKHSGFFTDDHVETFWLPALAAGKIVRGPERRPATPAWLSLLTVFKIKYMVLVAIVLGVYVLAS